MNASCKLTLATITPDAPIRSGPSNALAMTDFSATVGDGVRMLTNVSSRLTLVTITPVVPIQSDPSSALVATDSRVMDSTVSKTRRQMV